MERGDLILLLINIDVTILNYCMLQTVDSKLLHLALFYSSKKY